MLKKKGSELLSNTVYLSYPHTTNNFPLKTDVLHNIGVTLSKLLVLAMKKKKVTSVLDFKIEHTSISFCNRFT